MNKYYEQSPRFSAAGLTTGSILALIVAMAVSLAFDAKPVQARGGTSVAYTVTSAHA